MPAGPGVTYRAAGEGADDTDKNRLRTFPSLMSTPYEFQLLEWHATGQLALIDVRAGRAGLRRGGRRRTPPRPA